MERDVGVPLNRVVVTGLGAVSPYGLGLRALMEGLLSGRSAVVSCAQEWRQRIHDIECQVGAPLREPIDLNSIPRKFRRGMGPVAAMAVVAAREALEQAGISGEVLASGRAGVSFSSTMGSVAATRDFYTKYFQGASIKEYPSGSFFRIMSHTCAANVAHVFDARGRVLSPNAACASSLVAIGMGFEAIRFGIQDVMLCGGADELHAVVSASFDMLHASSVRYNDRPSQTPRPFDRDRDGVVCGEGAGCLVLESEASARKRGAAILAEVLGFSTLCAGTHFAQPNAQAVAQCLRMTLDMSRLDPDTIDYINAHATGTVEGDAAEAQGIREVFGESKPPVSSLKGHIGHTLGASGALELIASIRMMRDGFLLPTLNLETPGPGCEGLAFVMREAVERRVDTIVKNSFAFGGVNCVLTLQRHCQA